MYKLVVAVRKDLKLSKGKIAAQVAHAAVECTLKSGKNIAQRWYKNGQKKVVVKVESISDIMRLKKIAEGNDVHTSLIRDAGRTQLKPGTITCLGIGPNRDGKIDEITGGLPLL